MTDEIAASKKLFQMWRGVAEKHPRVERDGGKTRVREPSGLWAGTIRWQKRSVRDYTKPGGPWKDTSCPKLWWRGGSPKTQGHAIWQFERLAGERFWEGKISKL